MPVSIARLKTVSLNSIVSTALKVFLRLLGILLSTYNSSAQNKQSLLMTNTGVLDLLIGTWPVDESSSCFLVDRTFTSIVFFGKNYVFLRDLLSLIVYQVRPVFEGYSCHQSLASFLTNGHTFTP